MISGSLGSTHDCLSFRYIKGFSQFKVMRRQSLLHHPNSNSVEQHGREYSSFRPAFSKRSSCLFIRSQQPLDDTSFESDSPNLTTNASDVASLNTELAKTLVVYSRTELRRSTLLLPTASNDTF